jgi:hypothetical protein
MSYVEELTQESGFVGELESLSGIKGVKWRGRQMSVRQFTIAGGASEDLCQDNGRRIAALITNNGPDVCNIRFGNSALVAQLAVNGVIQVDVNFPWTGKIQANIPTNTSVVLVAEVSVP